MKTATAHPEHASYLRDLDRRPESITQAYESLPLTDRGGGTNDRLHKVASQESMHAVAFYYYGRP
jgi:hypothetical protein